MRTNSSFKVYADSVYFMASDALARDYLYDDHEIGLLERLAEVTKDLHERAEVNVTIDDYLLLTRHKRND